MKNKIIIVAAILILTGGLATYAYSNDDGEKRKSFNRNEYFKELVSKLPADKAKLVEEALDKSREERKAVFENIRVAEKELKDILTAEKFDEKAFARKSDELQKLHQASRDKMNREIIALASDMTPDERKILSKILKSKFKYKHSGGKGFGKDADHNS